MLAHLLLDISYVGTRGNHLIGNININQSFPGPGAQGPRRPYFAPNPLVTNVTLRTNYGDGITANELLFQFNFSIGAHGAHVF